MDNYYPVVYALGFFAEATGPTQARSDVQVVVETSGDGPTPDSQSVITTLSEDGSRNIRKRTRVDEEASEPEPTVKVRKKGNGASESAVQVCAEWKYFNRTIMALVTRDLSTPSPM